VVKRPASVAGSHPQPRLFGAGLPSRARGHATPNPARPERALCPRRPGQPPHGGVSLGTLHNLDRIGRSLGYVES
jgi:hypothetical protein